MRKIALGTAQWGGIYGIANRNGIPNCKAINSILGLAIKSGVNTIDTASAYGGAEDVLGRQQVADLGFNIVTKTAPLNGLTQHAVIAAEIVRENFNVSLARLGTQSIYGLLNHHAEDLLGPCGDHVWQVMRDIRREGRVQKIGCSLYHPSELDILIERYDLDIIQVPLNIYDQRFLNSGAIGRAKRRGIEVHARSVFLQGLLLMSDAALPSYFDKIRLHHSSFINACLAGSVSPIRVALGFVTESNQVDKVIVGCESIQQFAEILAQHATESPLVKILEIIEHFALTDEAYINPGRWPRYE
jgi:aryl-alcohol dehydrogenase-like predicted oxidoreductase